MQINNNLNNISILFFSFVAIVVVINLFTTNNYGRANQQVVKLLEGEDHIFDYFQLHRIITEQTGDYILIDLRTEDEFEMGHLPGAINLAFGDLLDSRNLRMLRRLNEQTPVLYADTEARAQSARMLLLSKGLEPRVKVMGGNYATAVKFALDTFNPAFAAYKDEKARFDYRRFMQTGTTQETRRSEQPAGIIPAVQEVTVSIQGGC